MSQYARVAVPRPLYRTFLYRIPDSLTQVVQPGCRVVVPFGRRELIGWVDTITAEPESIPSGLRDVLDAPDAEPVLDSNLLSLCRWISRYYIAPLGLTFRAALPTTLSAESAERLRLIDDRRVGPTPAEVELINYLRGRQGAVKLSSVRKALGPGPWASAAQRLEARRALEIQREGPSLAPPVRVRQVVSLSRELASLQERDRIFRRARRQRELFEYLESVGGRAEVAHLTKQLGISRTVVYGLANKGLADVRTEEMAEDLFATLPEVQDPRHTPTDAQAAVIQTLVDAANTTPARVFVLRGVTGSGKTLVYLELLRELVVRKGQGAIVLVPEISLTPQTLGRFRAAFGEQVALLHSALGEGERYAEWTALRNGEKSIVVGARSAVFAPVQKLAAIIIDEEHEGSYKQSDPAPRYHARDVALVRARHTGALCVFGSATPSLESWQATLSGTWHLLELPERIGSLPLPTVQLVDLREERKRREKEKKGRSAGPVVLSSSLREALQTRLHRGEQSILLLNRRGYSTFAQCRECGSVRSCWQCNVSLTHHWRPPRLVCHHCNHQEPVPELCPQCGAPALSHQGVGTEQVERVIEETFPAARIARMDVDTTTGKWSHHQILERVERRQVDILLGTQMIAKGLDFPNVTLVGVINADVGLNIPDFRASERTFQLLTQVAGRAGRSSAGGTVILQTALPSHYAVRFAIEHDYRGFATRELEERVAPAYPPHIRLANIVFSGRDELHVQQAAESALRWLTGLVEARRIEELAMLGPAPCPIDRIRSRWRWHLLLKSGDGDVLGRVLRYFANRFEPPSGELRLEIDRDPASLL